MVKDYPVKLLLVDNYDSFTFNLKNLLLSQEGVSLVVRRNDEDFISEVAAHQYDGAIIGPGPGSPEDDDYFGYNKQLIREYGVRSFPILGVCLGFQGIFHCFGGNLKLGREPVHGKVSELFICTSGTLLKDVPEKTPVMRYHSIVADVAEKIPADIEITSYPYTEDGENADKSSPMSLEHKQFPIYGVQFHPESFATKAGETIITNFLEKCKTINYSNGLIGM